MSAKTVATPFYSPQSQRVKVLSNVLPEKHPARYELRRRITFNLAPILRAHPNAYSHRIQLETASRLVGTVISSRQTRARHSTNFSV